MTPGREIPMKFTDPSWKYPLIAGGVTAPLTALFYWQAATQFNLTPVLVAGVIAGYLYADKGPKITQIGVRASIIAGIPALGLLFEIATAAYSGIGGPGWFQTAAYIGTAGFFAFIFAVVVVSGIGGAHLGRWLAMKTGRHHSVSTASDGH